MQTKDEILLAALELFARDGYEAVSMRDIAGAVGLSPGAIYRHYAGKRDLLHQIVARMARADRERAQAYEMPEGPFPEMAARYRDTPLLRIQQYSEAQFRYWTQDPVAANFRRMLTLEQYRDPELAALYQNHLAVGPLGYMEELFREMMDQGFWKACDPKQLALSFYGPIFLLMAAADGELEQDRAAELVHDHVRRFTQAWAAEGGTE